MHKGSATVLVILLVSALLVGGSVIYRSQQKDVLGAPVAPLTRSLVPETDSQYYLGTTTPSTVAYAGGIFDQLCLTADTCRTTWPAGGGGGSATDAVWELVEGGALDFIRPTTTQGFVVAASSTLLGDFHVETADVYSSNFYAGDGGTTAASYGFTDDQHTGWYSTKDNSVSLTLGGSNKLTFDSNNGQIQGTGGFVTVPTYSFLSDPQTGMYNLGVDYLGFSINAVDVAHFASDGILNVANGIVSRASSTFTGNLIAAGQLQASSTSLFNGLATFYNGINVSGTYTALDGTGLTNGSGTLNCDTADASTQGCVTAGKFTEFETKISSTTAASAGQILMSNGSNWVAQSTSTIVKTDSGATTTLDAGLVVSKGNVQVSTLINCNIDTDGSGNFVCGTDAEGGTSDYDAWSHPTSGVSATSSGIIISASSTINSNFNVAGEMIINDEGQVFNNTPTLSTLGLAILSDSSHNNLGMVRIGGTANTGPTVLGYRGTGTPTSVGVPGEDYELLEVTGRGYDGVAWSGSQASVSLNAADIWNSANHGTYISFNTTPIDSTTQTERLRVTHDGDVGIGTTTPSKLLTVEGTASLAQLETGWIRSTSTATSTFAGGLVVSTGGLTFSTAISCGKLYTDTNGEVLCGTDATGGTSDYDAWSHPVAGVSATSSGIIAQASSTISSGGIHLGGAFSTSTGVLNHSLLLQTDQNTDTNAYLLGLKYATVTSATYNDAKAIIAFINDVSSSTAWIAVHKNLNASTIHNHLSFETIERTSNQLQSRFEIPLNCDGTECDISTASSANFRVGSGGTLKLVDGDINAITSIDLFNSQQEATGLRIASSTADETVLTDPNNTYFRVDDDIHMQGTTPLLAQFGTASTSIWSDATNASSTLRLTGEGASDYRGVYLEYGGVPNVAILGTNNTAARDFNNDIPQIVLARAGGVDVKQAFTVSSTATSTFSNNGVIVSAGGMQLSTLKSCNLDTDSSGNLVCGTDSTGGTTEYDAWTHPVAGTSATTSNMLFTAASSTFNGKLKINDSLSASSSLSVAQLATFGSGVNVNNVTITNFEGTGLTVAGGALTTTLGTAIDTSEITDDTIAFGDVDHTITLAGNPGLAASQCFWGANGIICEGSTANDFEALFTVTDPTADRTYTFPNSSITVAGLASAMTGTFDGNNFAGGAIGQGDILYGSAAGTISELAKDTNATRYLSNTGASNNPAWAQVNLTNGVTGTLPIGNGGLGLTTIAQGDLLYGSAADTFAGLTITASGTVLMSNGTLPVYNATSSLFDNIHDAITLTGEDYLSLSGQAITANAIDTDNIAANTIQGADIEQENTWADNDILTYDSATDGFTGLTCAEIPGLSADLCDGNDATGSGIDGYDFDYFVGYSATSTGFVITAASSTVNGKLHIVDSLSASSSLAVLGVSTFTGAVNLPSDAVDTITEIASGLKSGSDAVLITGTAGNDTECAQWNADGDLVTSGGACGGSGIDGYDFIYFTDYSATSTGLIVTAASSTINGKLKVYDSLSASSSLAVALLATFNAGINVNNVTITDFEGDGLTVSGGSLTADLGTAITSSEITDGEVTEADLNIATAGPADNEILTYNLGGTNFDWHTLAELGIQAQDAVLDDLSALSVVADNEFIVGTGAGTYGHESGATAVTSLENGVINVLLETEIDASSELAALMDDETGTAGNLVFSTSPSLTTPSIAGATLTGVIEGGGATSFEIPNGGTPTVDAAGEIALDTTDNQLLIADSGNTAYVAAKKVQKIWSVTVASTSPALKSGGLLKVPTELDGYTMTAIRCSVQDGTSQVIAVEDEGTNSTEDITCATSVTSDDGSITNATVTAAEEMYIDFGATTGTVNYVTISVFGTWTIE